MNSAAFKRPPLGMRPLSAKKSLPQYRPRGARQRRVFLYAGAAVLNQEKKAAPCRVADSPHPKSAEHFSAAAAVALIFPTAASVCAESEAIALL